MSRLLIINLNTTNKLEYNSIDINSKEDVEKLKKVEEKYAIFYNKGTTYLNVDFERIMSFMEENKLLLYALAPSFSANNKTEKSNFINQYEFIEQKDELYNLALDSYIINTKLFKDLSVTENYEEDILIHILSNTKKYYQSKDEKVIKETKIINDVAKYPLYNNKKWYLSYIKNSLLKVVKNTKSHYVKNLVFTLYLHRLYTNCQQSSLSILNDEEYNEFLKISRELLSYIDDDIITFDNLLNNLPIKRNILDYILRIKYDNKVKYEIKDNGIVFKESKLLDLEQAGIIVNTINSKDNKLIIDCTVDGVLQKIDPIVISVDGKEIVYELTHIYANYKVFGRVYYHDETIRFILDLDKDKKVSFKTTSGIPLVLRFLGVHSKLNDSFKRSYWNVNKKCLKYRHNNLVIRKRSVVRTFFNEIALWFNILTHSDHKNARHAIIMRSMYYLTLPRYKNRDIWITFDKISKSGDCGEYFYRYAVKNHEIYYILSPRAKFYKKLKEETKNVLPYGSKKTKILALHSKKMFVSDSISIYFCGFSSVLANYCKDLLNYEVHCIQHGLTMQDLAFRQNRLFDNISKYYIASKYERENLLKREYGYSDENIIDTGIPRFDGLHDKSENIILLSPTWRVNVASNISNDKIRARNNTFKSTEYYKVYNGLINNEKLLNLLKNKKYKVIFLIHPTLISNKDDYDKNDYVDIISSADVNYEDILTKAKIMITDYSGVQYDFAYMHKPIIYYHTPLLPPSYGDGVMDYKNMGFGDIVDNENDLVDCIEKLLNNKSKIEKKYEDRIKSFFLFDDFNSCKRIYEVNAKK